MYEEELEHFSTFLSERDDDFDADDTEDPNNPKLVDDEDEEDDADMGLDLGDDDSDDDDEVEEEI